MSKFHEQIAEMTANEFLAVLRRSPGLSATDLREILKRSRANVDMHLKRLEAAGKVVSVLKRVPGLRGPPSRCYYLPENAPGTLADVLKDSPAAGLVAHVHENPPPVIGHEIEPMTYNAIATRAELAALAVAEEAAKAAEDKAKEDDAIARALAAEFGDGTEDDT